MVEHTMTKETLENRLTALCGKEISACSEKELYTGLLSLVQEMAKDKESNQGKKKLYYISAEFLIGKLLSNNMINLGIYDTVKNLLEENGKSLSAVEETEPEPSLGNGGLGRLAACFLDSIATLGLNGDGVGLNYHFGLFKQLFKDNKQVELIGSVVVAGNFNVIHTGCKGEVLVWNFIGYICFCQPGSILNPRIWFFCLFVVFKQLLENTEMVI